MTHKIDREPVAPRFEEPISPAKQAAGAARRSPAPASLREPAESPTPHEARAIAALAGAAPAATSMPFSRASLEPMLTERAPASSPAVQALLKTYGVPHAASRPEARFLRWTAELQASLANITDAETVPDEALAAPRRALFMLEGLSRLYGKRFGAPMKRLRAEVKALEDELGALDYRLTMQRELAAVDLPKKAKKELDEAVANERAKLQSMLGESWRPQKDGRRPAIARMLHTLERLEWDDATTDRRYLKHELGRRLQKVADQDLDMTDLEGGIHELRRQLRWLPIYLMGLDGMATLDDSRHPIPAYAHLVGEAIADSKYAKLPPSAHETASIHIATSLYLALTEAVEILGNVKDEIQLVDALAEALHGTKHAHRPEKARARALELLGKPTNRVAALHQKAAAVYGDLSELGLLGALRREITAAR